MSSTFGPRGCAAALALLTFAASPAFSQDDGLPPPSIVHAREAGVPTNVTTKFDVQKDGLPFVNFGDIGGQGGNCLGMSLIAIDNFHNRMAGDRRSNPTAPNVDGEDSDPGAVDPRMQETVSAAQMISISRDYVNRNESAPGQGPPIEQKTFDDPSNLNAAIHRMARSHQPQVFTMSGPGGAHANVLFGYQNGRLQLYDPNYPGKTIEWPFDPVTGLGPHPVQDGFYGTLNSAGAAPFSHFTGAKVLKALRQACAAGSDACTIRYATLDATAKPDGKGGVTVSGRITRVPFQSLDGDSKTTTEAPPVTDVWVAVNGSNVGRAHLNPDGTYSFGVPEQVFTRAKNDIRVVAIATITNPQDQSTRPVFAGYTETSVAPVATAAEGPRTGMAQAVENGSH